ncbi:VOC family protein [Sphingobium lignivorans]|uniref:Catechol 2,3-dioxygenase-like lactoylglutathione lyase family enzyme n=1 Tax=Sphingobium lignivorans TaxID=2735886 RepID=A0ABR6NCP2_9SPHN|nr:VOC family protein [Sphingobium lignivorans]MBB5984442.1 catechol 2,3-dioxygenase-like lactoylglutathione lyase family enzyme [Sphingobium lignivorans]
MHGPFKTALVAISLLMAPATMAQPSASPAPAATPEKPRFTQDSMNVYRRFEPGLTPQMVTFYGEALGLKPLQPIQLNASQQMILFGIGTGQIKLAAGLKEGRLHHVGGPADATGIRLFALRYPDEAALTARFKAAGFPAPAFKDMGGGLRGALVSDPAGFGIQLVIDPQARPGVDVGINVSDLERSRAFYRSFVGLEELPPVEDRLLGVTKYPFRHGETTINLWSAGKDLPADTGSAGIQYVIGNVDGVNAAALRDKVTVEEPLGGLPNFSIRFVWLNDPDGVTNYFAQPGANERPATGG